MNEFGVNENYDNAGWNTLGFHRIHNAAMKGDLDAIEEQLENDVNIDIVDGSLHNRTALHWAALRGHFEAVKLLVESKATIDFGDDNGSTALMFADGVDMSLYLLDQKADINKQNSDGFTALMWSAEVGDAETLNLLLEKKADAQLQDIEGHTALDVADDESILTVLQKSLKLEQTSV